MSRLEKIDRLNDKARQRTTKRSKRKEELADFAIDALKQLGYARTSLRDIAEHSGVSVGMLHYYFEDKVDLISFCVRRYKATFIDEMDKVILGSTELGSLAENFADSLSRAIRDDAETHRLWYDIRTQALFEDSFQDVVSEIEAGLIELVERLLDKINLPNDVARSVYLNLDGSFRYYLQRHIFGDATAVETFRQSVLGQLRGTIERSMSQSGAKTDG